MKNLILIFSLIGCLSIISIASRIKTEIPKSSTGVKLPKEITLITGAMVYVPSGSFTSGFFIDDSLNVPARRITVQAFYMSQTEVTNQQYRNFYKDMVIRVGKDSAAFYIPDTNTFIRDLTYSYADPMKNHYYSHPAYDNYPVIGVSWNQAKGYVSWINSKMEEVYKAHPDWREKYALNHFRIPTEMEWEYAAKGNSDPEAREPLYSWGNDYMKVEKGKIVWKGNFGSIIDKSGLTIKSYLDDDAFFMADVNSYEPNIFGLYNMSGNVSEWVEDVYRENILDSDLNYFRKDSSNFADKFKLVDPENLSFDRVIKGGSFLDAPAWCLSGNRRAMAPDSSRCDVGFRVCSTMFYFKEK